MPFEKGKSGNPQGKKPGTKSKRVTQWETFSRYCLNGGLKKFSKEMGKLKGEAYIDRYIKLLEHFKPKLSRQEFTGKDGETFTPTSISINVVKGNSKLIDETKP